MLTRQFGVQLQHNITDLLVFMLIISKTIEEILKIITMNQYSAHFGRKTRILKTLKMQDVLTECHVPNVMAGKRKNFILLFIARIKETKKL